MKTIKYILLDASGTLIHKPSLWTKYLQVLARNGYNISEKELKYKHKILSEIIKFPDVTSETFYNTFNKELLNSLGIIDDEKLLSEIFNSCKYLPWEKFDDINHLTDYNCQLGVLSNFNAGLRKILKNSLPEVNFEHIFISEEENVAKPNLDFYKIALKKIGLQPSEILYIGDSLKLDIIPALELGLNVQLIDRDCTFESSPYHLRSFKEIVLN